jgi:hypothetical protein
MLLRARWRAYRQSAQHLVRGYKKQPVLDWSTQISNGRFARARNSSVETHDMTGGVTVTSFSVGRELDQEMGAWRLTGHHIEWTSLTTPHRVPPRARHCLPIFSTGMSPGIVTAAFGVCYCFNDDGAREICLVSIMRGGKLQVACNVERWGLR